MRWHEINQSKLNEYADSGNFDSVVLKANKPLDEYASKTFPSPYSHKDIRVAINPSYRELRVLVDNSTYNIYRGYYNDGKFYFWNANDMDHYNMAEMLGIKFNKFDNLMLEKYQDTFMLDFNINRRKKVIHNSEYIKQNFDFNKDGYPILKTNKPLDEYQSIDVPSRFKDIRVAINPSKVTLWGILQKVSSAGLRGLFDEENGDFYFWDAAYMEHFGMSKKLNIQSRFGDRVDIFKNDYTKKYRVNISSRVARQPYVKRTFDVNRRTGEAVFIKPNQ